MQGKISIIYASLYEKVRFIRKTDGIIFSGFACIFKGENSISFMVGNTIELYRLDLSSSLALPYVNEGIMCLPY